MNIHDSIYYNKLKSEIKFNTINDDEEGKRLLAKLYIDLVCANEIGSRKKLKDLENNCVSTEYSIKFNSNEKLSKIKIDTNFLTILNTKAKLYSIQNNITIFSKEYIKKDKSNNNIYLCINDNNKYGFIKDSFEKKDSKDYKFIIDNSIKQEKEYHAYSTEFNITEEEINNKDFYYCFKSNKDKISFNTNQLIIYKNINNEIKCIGSSDTKKKLNEILNNKNNKIITNNQVRSNIKNIDFKTLREKIEDSNKFTKENIEKIKFIIKGNKIEDYIEEISIYSLENIGDEKDLVFGYYPIDEIYKFNKSSSILSENVSKIFTYSNDICSKKILLFKDFDFDCKSYKINNSNCYSISEENPVYIKKSISFPNNFKKLKRESIKSFKNYKFFIIKIDIFYPDNAKINKEIVKVGNNHIVMLSNTNEFKNDCATILNRLRNAVAHTRVCLDNNNYLNFENKHDNKIKLCGKIHKDYIDCFIEELHSKLSGVDTF